MAGFNGDRESFSGDLSFTAPAGGVTRGKGYKIGATYLVARETAVSGVAFVGAIQGSVYAAKVTGVVVAKGDAAYQTIATNVMTNAIGSGTGTVLIGKFLADAATADTKSLVFIVNPLI